MVLMLKTFSIVSQCCKQLQVYQLMPIGPVRWSQCLMFNRPSCSTQNWVPSAINCRLSSLTSDCTSRPPRPSPRGAINNRPTANAVQIGLADGQPAMANFLSPEFGKKFQGEKTYFWRYPNVSKTQCSMGRE